MTQTPIQERLGQIKQMIEVEEKSPAEIAIATGLSKRTVAVYASRAKAKGKHHKPRNGVRTPVFYLDPRVKKAIDDEARNRYMDERQIIELLLTAIVDDNLFSAILDG